jgi:hypothetical protein
VSIWYILWLFGILFPFWYEVPKEIWQSCFQVWINLETVLKYKAWARPELENVSTNTSLVRITYVHSLQRSRTSIYVFRNFFASSVWPAVQDCQTFFTMHFTLFFKCFLKCAANIINVWPIKTFDNAAKNYVVSYYRFLNIYPDQQIALLGHLITVFNFTPRVEMCPGWRWPLGVNVVPLGWSYPLCMDAGSIRPSILLNRRAC